MALYRRRGGRRLVGFAKRRCLLFLFAVSLLFLVYLAFFGVNCPFLGLQLEKVNRGTSTIETLKSRWKYGREHFTENVYNSIEVRHSYSITEKGFQGSTSLPKTDLNYSNEGDVSYGRIAVNTPTIINMDPTKWEMLLPKFGFQYNDDRNVSRSRTDGKTPALANLNPNNWEERLPRPSKSKSHRHHGPCKIDFKETVDDLLEPQSYMNFTKFSVNYVEEENHHEHILFEPQFGGHQTLEERENSYYARDQTLNCGFVKGPSGCPSSGFDLTEKDKEYMANCRVVVSSCIFGSSDFLRRPASKMMGTFSKNNVCFVMFLDELTMTKLSSEGQVPDDKGNIGLWRIAVVKNLPYIDMRRTGKVPKFLSHRLFPYARYSIWIDSKMRLQADPMLILENFLWRKKAEFAISNHYDRHCVWEEVLQNKRLNKYNHTAIDEQFQFYQSDGLIKFNESDKNSLLPSYVPEGSFIVRAHTPMSNLFSCLWFNEVNRFTSRDQLSFAYTFLKLRRTNPGKPFFLNMFKDCERRAVGKLFHHRVEDQHPSPP